MWADRGQGRLTEWLTYLSTIISEKVLDFFRIRSCSSSSNFLTSTTRSMICSTRFLRDDFQLSRFCVEDGKCDGIKGWCKGWCKVQHPIILSISLANKMAKHSKHSTLVHFSRSISSWKWEANQKIDRIWNQIEKSLIKL